MIRQAHIAGQDNIPAGEILLGSDSLGNYILVYRSIAGVKVVHKGLPAEVFELYLAAVEQLRAAAKARYLAEQREGRDAG